MKKVLGKIFKTVFILALIGAIGYGGYWLYEEKLANTETATSPAYSQVLVIQGNLQKTVAGTGTLSISKKETISLPYGITLDEVYVREGQEVSVGTPLASVNKTALQTTIDSIVTEIETLDSSLATLAKKYSATSYITTAMDARVKIIYANVGDTLQGVIEEHNALMVLSVDGKMVVELAGSTLKTGDAVTIVDGTYSYEGFVEKAADGVASITFADTRTLEGATVEIRQNSLLIGTGTAHIHMPYYVSTTAEGYIAKVYPAVNAKLEAKANLFYITNPPLDAEYSALLKQREEKTALLKEVKAALEVGELLSPVDGIISTVATASRSEQSAYSALATIYVGDAMQMVISVDELDISGLKVGQTVSVSMDSVSSKTYTGTVSYISQIGSSSSGVTTYSVTLAVQGDELLKMGMNGTASIVVSEVSGATLVPISALYTTRGTQYVMLYNPDEPDSAGTRTVVTTGLSNDSYAEVLSGLSVGDTVLVSKAADSTGTNYMMGMDMGGFDMSQLSTMFGDGTSMPAMVTEGGGTFNFNNNGGGGGQRNTNNGGSSGGPSGN